MKRFIKNVPICLGLISLMSACSSSQDLTYNKGAAEHAHIEDELIVLDPPVDYLRHLPEMGLEVIEEIDLDHVGDKLYHLKIIDGSHPHVGRKKHEVKFPDVVVDVHHLFEHHAKKIDKSYTGRTAAKWGHAQNGCSDGLVIGMIDGVVNVDNPAFAGSKMTYRSFVPSNRKVLDSGHGTGVASVIAGKRDWKGVLPGVELYAANVFHEGFKGKSVGSSLAIMRALDWMVKNNVPIVNMSIGGPQNKLIEKSVNRATQKGIIVVASAGNDGPFTKKINYPSANPGVIAITAVDRDNRNARFASAGKYIDFATPGVRLWVAGKNGGQVKSGTSFAAPIFTAYAAAAMKHKGLSTKEEIISYFKKFAIDTAREGHDKYTGWGVVEVNPICGS